MTDARKIRVAIFSNSPSRGGVEQHILTLLRGLDRNRFEPFFVCDPALIAILGNEVPADVKTFTVELRAFSHLNGALQFRKWLRQNRIDLVHCHMSWATMFGGVAAKTAGVPVIETTHVRELWRKGWKSSYSFDRATSQFVDRYIAVSHANAKYLVDEKGLPSAKVIVIQNGADLKSFSPRMVPSGLRQAFHIPEGAAVLLVPARLEEQKGHRFLIPAVAKVAKQVPNLCAVFLGSGALRSTLIQQVERSGLSEIIRFIDFQSNPADWFALSTFVVLPSLYEGLPLVAIEALACERTLVATAVDGTPEIVVNEQTGLLVPPADPDALASAVLRLLQDEPLRNRLARDGRRHATSHFSIERQVAETEDLYSNLLGIPLPKQQSIYSECP